MKRAIGLWALAAVLAVGCAEERPDGPYTLLYEDGGTKEEGTYRNGELDGKFVQYYEDGSKKAEGFYVDGELEGELVHYEAFVEYHDTPAGQRLRAEGTYKDGKRDGAYAVYYGDSGQKRVEGFYRNTKKDSVWVWYAEGGNRDTKETWDNGEMMSQIDCRERSSECD